MKVLGIIFLCILAVMFGPALIGAILGGAFSLIVSLGVLLLVGGLIYFVAFLVLGSVFLACLVAGAAVLLMTMGAWLPVLIVGLIAVWFYKRTQAA
ncbi:MULTISPECIES: hypothetical protein [Gammaproteobacteria]|uniref:hypothetical protein n=1 Tax=Gammaproteobacteria TaxID=1236 RepID=UPI000DCFF3F3|nr:MULTISPECIES: hypothetical protein [Gammaproteobacteria]RTE85659.1 hypothetical protein DQX04_12240 [Aliidiomarina sp. B3213]TCZ89628.1 hypothetical protein EYQ95_12170 [Lysobacter sp. N42]